MFTIKMNYGFQSAFSVPLREWHMGKIELNRRHFLILLFNAGSPLLEYISQQGSMSHKRGFRSPLKCSLLTDNDNENPYFHVVYLFLLLSLLNHTLSENHKLCPKIQNCEFENFSMPGLTGLFEF